MTDTKITDEDRRSALDAFADAPAPMPVIIEQGNRLPGEARVFGAQRVAVKRDLEKVRNNLTVLASMAGSDWSYRFPVKDKGGTKKSIEGPSIKLANEVAREFGNCDIDCRAYDLGDSWLFYARFVDLETGFSLTRPFQQRQSQGSLRTKDPERQRDIAFQIGVSKAVRNVICNALQSLTDFAFEQARGQMVKRIGKNIQHYREKITERLDELNVDLTRVEVVVGRRLDKWLAPDMARIIAELQAVADGMADPADIWPVFTPDQYERLQVAEHEGKSPAVEKPKAKAKSAKPVPDQGDIPTLLWVRTKIAQCGTVDVLDEFWRTNVEPWGEEAFGKAEWARLVKERDERMAKFK